MRRSELDSDRRTAAGNTAEAQRATRSLGRPPYDVEPEPGRLASAVPALEDERVGQAGPVVADREHGAAARPVQPLPSPVTLRVLTSNELTDINDVAVAAAAATNVKLKITYVGSAAGAQTVASGKASGKYDAIWFDSNAYLALQPKASSRIANSTKIMTSPVAFGLYAEVAKKLGWDEQAPTWAQIAQAAGQKKFRYGMSNPATSNPAKRSFST